MWCARSCICLCQEFLKAGEIKKRAEALHAELTKMLDMGNGATEGFWDEVDAERHRFVAARPEEFKEDVRDKELFPDLPLSRPPIGARRRVSSAAPPSMRRQEPHQPLDPMPASKPDETGAVPEARGTAQKRASSEEISASDYFASRGSHAATVPLKDALLQFLLKREGCVARMNEVNNDRGMRESMRNQRPPIMAINKTWLVQHEDTFVLLKHESESFVAIEAGLRRQLLGEKDRKHKKPIDKSDQPRSPAYHHVIQKVPGVSAKPLVYEYSKEGQKVEESTSKSSPSSNSGVEAWIARFLTELRSKPDKTMTMDDLLAAVPEFGRTMGANRPREQRSLLLMFLESKQECFQVIQTGFGTEKKFAVKDRAFKL